MPATQGHEESAAWVCPEFIEAMVPDKQNLSRCFIYMQSGMMHVVTVDEPKMAFEEIVEVIREARKQQSDFDLAFNEYWEKEQNGKQKA